MLFMLSMRKAPDVLHLQVDDNTPVPRVGEDIELASLPTPVGWRDGLCYRVTHVTHRPQGHVILIHVDPLDSAHDS